MIKYLSQSEFIERIIPSKEFVTSKRLAFVEAICSMLNNLPSATHVVLFENLTMDSSTFGTGKCLAVGPGLTYPNVEACEGKWLNEMPSQRLYPVAFISRNQLLSGLSELQEVLSATNMSGPDMMQAKEDPEFRYDKA